MENKDYQGFFTIPKETIVTVGKKTYIATNDEEFNLLARRTFCNPGQSIETPRCKPSRRFKLIDYLHYRFAGKSDLIEAKMELEELRCAEQEEIKMLRKMRKHGK